MSCDNDCADCPKEGSCAANPRRVRDAAPAMLEALSILVFDAERLMRVTGQDRSHEAVMARIPLYESLSIARKALAKARGGG